MVWASKQTVLRVFGLLVALFARLVIYGCPAASLDTSTVRPSKTERRCMVAVQQAQYGVVQIKHFGSAHVLRKKASSTKQYMPGKPCCPCARPTRSCVFVSFSGRATGIDFGAGCSCAVSLVAFAASAAHIADPFWGWLAWGVSALTDVLDEEALRTRDSVGIGGFLFV